MCKEKKRNSTYIFYGMLPFEIFFLWKPCPLYNFNTVKNIFMKLDTNIKCHQMMWGEEES